MDGGQGFISLCGQHKSSSPLKTLLGCAVTKKKKSEEEEEESFFAETVSLWSSSKVMGPC
jgi:hypothetical protein